MLDRDSEWSKQDPKRFEYAERTSQDISEDVAWYQLGKLNDTKAKKQQT